MFKSFFCLILCFLMLFAFVACNGDTSNGEQGVTNAPESTLDVGDVAANKVDFSAGYARADITPTAYPILLGGGGEANKTVENIYATSVAVSEGETTALFITLDVMNIPNAFYSKAVQNINKATKIDRKNIFLSATHNHSAPDMLYSVESWREDLLDKTTDIAKESVADLKPTEAYYGTTNTEGLAFVRRYLLDDGTYRGIGVRYGWASTANEVAHESEADSELQILRFVREDAKDIVMANWQAHAAHAYSTNSRVISGDFIYYFRQEIEGKNDDILFAYYQGSAGNINLSSNVKKVGGQYPKVGKSLAAYCNELLPNLEKIALGNIKIQRSSVKLDIGNDSVKDSSARVQAALDIIEGRDSNNNLRNKYKFEEYEPSAVYARYLLRQNNPTGTYSVSVTAITFGDVAFVSAPFETFDTNGMEVKSASQFKSTFICAYTNGYEGYLPSALAFEHGQYEVYSCKFAPGSGEKISGAMIDALKKLYEN